MKERIYTGELAIEANIYGKEKKYWFDNLSGEISKSLFRYDYINSEIPVFSKYLFSIDNKIFERFCQVSSSQDKRLHMVLIALMSEILRRYSGKNDIIIGTPVYKQDIEGDFINTVLPIRNYIDADKSFKYLLLEQLRPTLIEAIKNQNYPYEAILYQLGMEGEQNPLFDVAVVLENIQDISYIKETYYNILFSFIRKTDKLECTIHYNINKYSEETIKQIAKLFVRLSDLCLNNIEQSLSSLSLIDQEEEERILKEFNHAQETSDFEHTVDALFQITARENPDKKAVVLKGQSLTYAELDDKSDKLCAFLMEKNVKKGEIVGIQADYSIELIIGLLAILKCGAAYMPININYPEKRVKLLLSDANVKVFLAKNYRLNLPGVEEIDLVQESIYKTERLAAPTHDHIDAAYIIYTSGSTGLPKGVIVEHKSINRLIRNTNILKFEKKDRILQTGALEFDASTFEIWGALLNGLTLFLAPDKLILDCKDLQEAIEKNEITIMWLTSSLFNQMVESDASVFDNLKYLLIGGEKLSTYHVNKLRDKNKSIKIINGYGPTENTTFSVTHLISENYQNNIPIGKPIKNSSAFILDDYERLSPIGICGELCVGGAGLARGYLNNPELTHDKFIINQNLSGILLYKTGDIALWNDKGIIEFIGRKDEQLKIRGYRIEPGEIENVIRGLKGVSDVVVVDRQVYDGEKRLCAYIVGEIKLEEIDIRDTLKALLPDYMIPFFYTKVDRINLTSNGKVDKKALPEPTLDCKSLIKPHTEVERKVIKIWSEVLGIPEDKIGINDNFFDLGGHSLKATTLVNQLYKEFNKKIPLMEIFNNQIVKELALYIEQVIAESYQSIPKADEKNSYSLSSAQHRLYVLQQMDVKQTNYNIPLFLILEGNVNNKRIEETFRKIIARHEILRTSIQVENNVPVQLIHQNAEFELEKFSGDKDIKEVIRDFVHPFDLSKAPLIRVGLKELDVTRSLLLIDIHHIVVDGSSLSLLVKELMEIYSGSEPEPVKLTYKDFAEWQNSLLTSGAIDKQKHFWLDKLSGELPVIQLPYDFQRPLLQSFDGAEYNFEISRELTQALRKVKGEKGTMFMVLLAIYNVLLSKLSNSEDVIVGSPIAGRQHSELVQVFGLFVNTIVFRNKPLNKILFSDFLRSVIDESITCFENQDYQFELLINELNLSRDTGRNPLFDVAITFHNEIKPEEITNIRTKELQLRPYLEEKAFRASKFDLMLCIKEADEKLLLSFEYCTKLFKEETIKRFAIYFLKIVEQIVKTPDIRLQDISITDIDDVNIQMHKLNSKKLAQFKNITINQCFEEYVSSNPNRIALVYNGVQLTYKELNKRANKVAHFLIANGVRENQPVGLHMERSVELVICILGILKSGAGYLPIDPSIPEKRKKLYIKDSDLSIVLTDQDIEIHSNAQLINISEVLSNPELKISSPSVSNSTEKMAYIIYTSGSTGIPKGVIISHKNVMSLLKNEEFQFDFNENDAWTLFHSYGFDFSVWEIFGSLLNGSKLIIVPDNIRKDPSAFVDLLEKENVTVLNQTPSAFINLNNFIPATNTKSLNVKYLIFGGEALMPTVLSKWKEIYPSARIINMYGITETTIHVTYKEVGLSEIKENKSNIGKPIPCLHTYILGKEGELLPVGVEGEIYVEGEGVSIGYLNNPELTNQVFGNNPFHTEMRLYKSGDLGIVNSGGEIIYTGRNDQQVKVRGFRIELSEVQKCLLRLQQVEETVVIMERNEQESQIFAYLRLNNTLSQTDLRTRLIEYLPEYMIPSKFFETDHFPITSQGKLDTAKLKNIAKEIVNKSRNEDIDEIEEKLVSIVSRLLHKDCGTISVFDDFFDIGGHSLIATQLVFQIGKELKCKLRLTDVFRNPVLKDLSKIIRQSVPNYQFKHLKKVEKKEYYTLSPSQKRLFTLYQLDKSSVAYNMPLIFGLTDDMIIEDIKQILEKIIDRHESLRSYFNIINDKEVQFVAPKINIDIEFFQVNSKKESLEIYKSFIKPFDLTKAPLFRIAVLQYMNRESYLMLDIHHIISDGISQQILVNEFLAIQKGKSLNTMKYQYKDYAEWIARNINANRATESFWLSQYSDGVPISHFPIDYERKDKISFRGKRRYFSLPADLTNMIIEYTRKNNISINSFLFAAYSLLISKVSCSNDFVVGTVVGNREHYDVQSVIGFFVNTLGIRFRIDQRKTLSDYLQYASELLLQSFENQSYPFDVLIQKLKIRRSPNKHPLVENVFAYYDVTENGNSIEVKSSDSDLIQEMYNDYSVSHFDLMLYAIKKDKTIDLFYEYLIDLFNELTIQDLIDNYNFIISQIVNNPSASINALKLKSKFKEIQMEEDVNEGKFNL